MNDDNYEDDEIQKAKKKILEEEEIPNDDKLGNEVVVKDEAGEEEEDEQEKIKNQSKAEIVLRVATENIQKLFVDEYQEPHAAINVNNEHLETIPIRSRRFRNYLSSAIYKDCKMVIDSQTLKDVIGVLSAKAEFDESSEIVKLNLRVAESDGKLYYDLTNKNWEFIEITSSGWKVVNNLVLFHRYNNQLPQVYPSREYSPDIFDKFIALVLNKTNVVEEKLSEYQIIWKCYIICALIPGFPKAVPMPNGTQGAAKTTLTEFTKMLIDPCIAKTFSFPRDIHELNQQLSHNYVTYYDNISELKDWISDELCRAVSGSGSSRRRLYTDEDDLIRSLVRCIGLNGINLAATKADLLDRSVFFKLKRIPDEDRRYIAKVQEEYEQMKPELLGYIMDILVQVLKWKEVHGDLEVSKIPRMADWAAHCEIISRCMGNEEGKFLKAYGENAKMQTEQVMETSQIAVCLAHFVDTDPRFNGDGSLAMLKDLEGRVWGWVGIASSLKGELDAIAAKLKIDIHSKGYPKNPSWLIRKLNEIMHTLKDVGIEIDYDRTNPKSKIIMIRKLASLTSIPSKMENHAQNKGEKLDGILDGNNKTAETQPSQIHAQLDAIDGIDGNLDLKNKPQATCSKCGEPLDPDPFYAKLHHCEGID